MAKKKKSDNVLLYILISPFILTRYVILLCIGVPLGLLKALVETANKK